MIKKLKKNYYIIIYIIILITNLKTMSCHKTPVENINIAILGCVSAGKSTILNAMFCQDLSQCKIKRTTMMPTAFVETQNKHETMTPDQINTAISSINKDIIQITERGDK